VARRRDDRFPNDARGGGSEFRAQMRHGDVSTPSEKVLRLSLPRGVTGNPGQMQDHKSAQAWDVREDEMGCERGGSAIVFLINVCMTGVVGSPPLSSPRRQGRGTIGAGH
jgi:hypothetical protein